MDQKDRDLILSNLTSLEALVDLDFIIPFVIDAKIFTQHMLEDIYAPGISSTDRKHRFFVELPTRGPYAFRKFVDVLKKTGSAEAVKLLEPVTNTEQKHTAFLKHTRKFKTDQSVFSNSTTGITPTGEPTQTLAVRQAKVLKSGNLCYKMSSNPRGFCLIINNVDFKNLKEYRHGSDLDKIRLKMVFTQLGYIVEVKENLELLQMKSEFKKFASKPQHASVDSCVVIILSHGDMESVLGVDDEPLELNYIFERFNNENSPNLKLKPKMFFIQACRGGKFDIGVSSGCESPDASSVEIGAFQKERVPEVSDMHISYATNKGYISIRDHRLGSWYCQDLVAVLMEQSFEDDLATMLLTVERRVRQKVSGSGDKQSTSSEGKGWAKKLYFNPGLYES